MKEFSGRVKLVKGSYGFIGRESVRSDADSEMDLRDATSEDVFFLTADFGAAQVDDRLFFQVEEDPKRGPGYFRALPISHVKIELSFPDRTLDHPTVAVHWCLSPAARELIAKSSKDTTWYLAIVAQPHRREQTSAIHYSHRPGTTLSTWVGLKRIGDGFGFINFSRSGPHDVVAYLISSARTETGLKHHLNRFEKQDEIDVWNDLNHQTLATDSESLHFTYRGPCSRPDRVHGLTHTVVNVPEGIFAKPPSAVTKRMLEYFRVKKLRDQCEGRRIIPLIRIAGPFVILFWELIKRVWMVLLGIFHFCLAGGSALPLWRRAFTTDLSAQISNWKGELEYEALTDWTDNQMWKFPLFWTLIAAPLIWLLLAPPGGRGWPLAILIVVIFLIALLTVVTLYGDGIVTFLKRFKRKQIEQRELVVMKRIEQYASCDVPADTVVPPTTVQLLWSGIKRRVCRSYAD